jgi:hypothetical protein
VGQFVRHEKESGYTEVRDLGTLLAVGSWRPHLRASRPQIELYFETGNKVIRRNIFRDNRSTWMLNGRDTTLKKVLGVMEDAKIQIDNLCQFLPQDKVGEFSRMNPTQLLKATEAAITDGDLAAKHEELVEMQTNMRDKARVRCVSDSLDDAMPTLFSSFPLTAVLAASVRIWSKSARRSSKRRRSADTWNATWSGSSTTRHGSKR